MKVFNIYKIVSYLLLLSVLCSCNTTKVEDVPLTKADSLSTIKCENFFTLEGFNAQTDFQEGLNIYLTNSTDTNPFSSLLETMTKFRFLESKIYANNGTSLDLFEDCSRSEYKDLVLIGSIFKLGTEISKLSRYVYSGQMRYDNLKNTLQSGIIAPSFIGELVIESYHNGCISNLEFKDTSLSFFTIKYCKALEKYNDRSTSADIGSCFINTLAEPNYVCP